ncbi:MAG: glycosyltransferase family 2 protein [Erysipelotrichaceae bacterium]|nr:glycosyltransferase family 2 protein [Solobacterium sp.]MCI7445529.1 glycosyltransferase family 2 protein [Solobacterium sp.]MDY3793604.1 glycosyltransferase family 2 protein [Erysipelotrichaceae bacterium]
MKDKKVAVLIPCYNEELTVEKTVSDFKRVLPNADIYVYNNNSKDRTKELALKAGAIVKDEYRQGKGAVVRSMFRDIDADVYIMVDGDDTYPAEEVEGLITPVLEGKADMVIGDRLSSTYYTENKRPFHNFGNSLVKGLINFLFKSNLNDIMTGYRSFSKKFVKCMPVMSDGFQIETEMTIFALTNNMQVVNVPITYRDRPEGSESKLNTFSDGFKVLLTLFNLFKDNRPFLFFGCLSLIIFILGLVVGIPVIDEFIKTAYITKVPSAILAAALMLNAFLMFSVGIILDAIKNQKRYLFECHMNDVMSKYKED